MTFLGVYQVSCGPIPMIIGGNRPGAFPELPIQPRNQDFSTIRRPNIARNVRICFEILKFLKLKKIRFVQEILVPHRFRNVRKAISCNFVLLSSKLLRGAPRNDEKTVLKNSLVDNFGRR